MTMTDTTKHQKWLDWLDTYLGKKGFTRVDLLKGHNDYGPLWYASWERPQNRHAPANFITVRISNHPGGSLRVLTEQDRLSVLVDSTTKAEIKRQISNELRLQKAEFKRQISNELRLQKALHLLDTHAVTHENNNKVKGE